MARDTESGSRAALSAMLEFNDLISRFDIKAELIKELDRQANVLTALQRNPGVDPERLNATLDELRTIITKLRSSDYQPGQALRNDELTSAIRQRISIPGGTCNFDLPGYHYWLSKPANDRSTKMDSWFEDLKLVNDGTKLALGIIRESAAPTGELAKGGFFQQSLETNTTCHMVRVILSSNCTYFPEISAGKHRFTIRFLEQPDTERRPVQVEHDVEFELERCII